MADINNNYKRFQTYKPLNNQNTFKRDFMEQNYKVENKPFEKKVDLNEKKELQKIDNSFLEKSIKIGVNNQGKFINK